MHSPTSSLDSKRITAELLAYATSRLFPNVIFLGGGINKIGFYYDFIFSQTLPTDAMSLIEVELRKNLKEDQSIRFAHMMRENAQNYFMHHKQPFLADKAAAETVNVLELFQMGSFLGICPAFDITSTGELTPHVKLLELQKKEIKVDGHLYNTVRILGNCFDNPQELKVFSKNYERHRKKANHIELGKELHLFVQNEQVSEIELLWLPKGEQLKHILQNWIQPYFNANNAQFVTTPSLIKSTKRKCASSLFSLIFQEQGYRLGSSRLNAHSQILKSQYKAKQNLPLRVTEYSQSYHNQAAGDLDGILCNYSSYGDQTTLCCRKDKLHKEIISFLLFIEQITKIFSFEAQWCLVTSLKKSAKAKAEKEAIEKLLEAVQSCSFPLEDERFEEEEIDGPRLELRISDKLKRAWPCSTLTIVVHELKNLDFFNDEVKNEDNSSQSFSLVTQSVWGSLDRFVALLLEHYEGHLPNWLAPEQARVLVLGKNAQSFAKECIKMCQEKGIRITADLRDVKLSEKVHDAGKEKIPVSVVIGENEVNKKLLTVQEVQKSGKSQVLTLDQFLDKYLLETKSPILKED